MSSVAVQRFAKAVSGISRRIYKLQTTDICCGDLTREQFETLRMIEASRDPSMSTLSSLLGVSISGMKSRVQRGREKIRGMFEECCQISVDCRGRVVECQARDAEQVPEDCRATAAAWAARHGTKPPA